jgi:hypothetical protein
MTANTIPTESYSNFRSRFLLNVLVPYFILPIIIAIAALHLLKPTISLHPLLQIPLVILSIPVTNVIRVNYNDFFRRREARRLGAEMIPRVKTKWPGNIDLVIRMIRKPRTEYILEPILALMKEYKSNTINMGIFWGDQVCSKLAVYQK